VRLDPRQVEILERQRKAFREKFGRDPGPEDPVFFDPKADDPRPIDQDMLAATVMDAMKAAGIEAAKIHGYRRTGVLVTSENLGQWSAEDLDEWQAALDEYQSLSLRRN
jgi:hypothetical protein